MLHLNSRMSGTLAVFVILTPGSSFAQTVQHSFKDLHSVLKTGQTVVVTERDGRQTKRKIGALLPSSLTLLIPEEQVIPGSSVWKKRRTTDSLWNGTLIGLGVGAGVGLAAQASCGWPCPPLTRTLPIFAGIGAAVGAGIDAAMNRGHGIPYPSPEGQARRVAVAPLMARHGVLVSVGF